MYSEGVLGEAGIVQQLLERCSRVVLGQRGDHVFDETTVTFTDAVARHRLAGDGINSNIKPLGKDAQEGVVKHPTRVRQDDAARIVHADLVRQQGAHNGMGLAVRNNHAARQPRPMVNHFEDDTAAGDLSKVHCDRIVEKVGRGRVTTALGGRGRVARLADHAAVT